MKLRDDYNRYGAKISVHRCDSCDVGFTVCPPGGKDWGGCQAETCGSYDPSRDVDKLFDSGSPDIKRAALPPRATA